MTIVDDQTREQAAHEHGGCGSCGTCDHGGQGGGCGSGGPAAEAATTEPTRVEPATPDDVRYLVEKALRRTPLTREEALSVLAVPDERTLDLVAAVSQVRHAFFGRRVKVNYLVNLKSGLCPEDCGYCSQRLNSGADILKYSWLKPEEVVAAATAGIKGGAKRVCMVSSGRGPSNREVERVAGAVEAVKAEHPDVEICACLGLLKDGQAERLAQAGVDAYNHNLNTAESNYADICSTHTYADRVDTVEKAHSAGLSACSGLLAGMGETHDELVDVAMALREIGSDSIPVNFLIPVEGTPLAGEWGLTPLACLRLLAMVRLVAPDREVRMAGGRELHLRSLQPFGLQLANSIFLGDYLTTEGQPGEADIAMIADMGYVIEGADEGHLQGSGDAGRSPVHLRHRGVGTDLPPNA